MARSFRAAVVQTAKTEPETKWFYHPESSSSGEYSGAQLENLYECPDFGLMFEITQAEHLKVEADGAYYPQPHPSYAFGPLRPKDGTAPILSSSVREAVLGDPSTDGKTNEEMLRHIVLRLGRIHDIALELLHTNRIKAAIFVLNRHSTFVTDVWQNNVPLGYRTSLKIYQECLEKRDEADEV